MPIPAIAGQVLGIGLNAIGQSQQMSNQENLMEVQQQHQMQLNQQGAQLARENWDYTNFENQRKHMENAGLSVGMMYGGSGAGGATLGSGSGGSAASGNAPQNNAPQLMGIALQAEAIKSQIEVNKAETTKKGAETAEIEARTPTYQKGMELTDSQIKEIASKMGVNEAEVRSKLQNIEESKSKVEVNQATIPKLEAETGKATMEAERLRQITPEEVQNVKADTYKKYQEIAQKWKELDQQQQKIVIEKFKAEMEAKFPNIQEVVGGQMQRAFNTIDDIKDFVMDILGIDGKDLGKLKVNKRY